MLAGVSAPRSRSRSKPVQVGGGGRHRKPLLPSQVLPAPRHSLREDGPLLHCLCRSRLRPRLVLMSLKAHPKARTGHWPVIGPTLGSQKPTSAWNWARISSEENSLRLGPRATSCSSKSLVVSTRSLFKQATYWPAENQAFFPCDHKRSDPCWPNSQSLKLVTHCVAKYDRPDHRAPSARRAEMKSRSAGSRAAPRSANSRRRRSQGTAPSGMRIGVRFLSGRVSPESTLECVNPSRGRHDNACSRSSAPR